ncbi:uncharacterized protein LOC132679115 [Panthera onca]
MPGATPAWCEWERARAPGCVLLADIHGSCSGSSRVRVCVSVCVLVVLYWQEGRRQGRREQAGAGGGPRARAGWGAASPLSRSLPPQLDPVVKAEREAGWVRLAAYEKRRERERRGAEARRGEAGRKGCEPCADLSSASTRPGGALGYCVARTFGLPQTGTRREQKKRDPDLGRAPEPGAPAGPLRPRPPPARDPAVGKPSWRDAAWNCRGGLSSRRREAAEEFTVERCFVCSQTRCRVLRIPPRRSGKLGKCKLVTQTAGTLSIALRGAGRDGNSAEGRSCPGRGYSRVPGEGASLFLVGRRGAQGAVGWGGRKVVLAASWEKRAVHPRSCGGHDWGTSSPRRASDSGLYLRKKP